MVLYNFKQITVVPTAKDFIDIVLSKTQRKTPTEIHKQYAISRIRAFYMRKVRFSQQNFHDKLSQIIADFPLLDDIHPFYADLINILYDRDHYKLALGQINNARHLIDTLAKDYVRLLKYGDSLYRCKQLKRAGMGRMCTLMKKLGPSLAYLDQVRQHLARLPAIDPTTRTLILCGYPNVGKSSFMNKVTRADVDVQPYAFTTKSLYVGHTDYKYIKWQVIDTPGILDHPIEERNTIEMQSITALAHLQAAILFIIDISMQCGYTIKEQVALFHSIKPLFVGKPLLVLVNKIDVMKPENVDPSDWSLIQSCSEAGLGGVGGVQVIPMSTLTEEGVSQVKNIACDTLLEARVEKKLKANRITNNVNRLHVAMPIPRDNKVRETAVPESVVDHQAKKSLEPVVEMTVHERMQKLFEDRQAADEKTRDMWARGEVPEMNTTTWKERYLLANPEWRFDIIPEILDGKNISDFVDPDIDAMLAALEREEDERMEQLEAERPEREARDAEDSLDEEEKKIIAKIRRKKKITQHITHIEHGSRSLPRAIRNKDKTVEDLENLLKERGFEDDQAADAVEGLRERSRSRGRKRERSASASKSREPSAYEGLNEQEKRKKQRVERSRSRTLSLTPAPGSGMKDAKAVMKSMEIGRKAIRMRNRMAKVGESDRSIQTARPKHLLTGKRGIGKTQRR